MVGGLSLSYAGRIGMETLWCAYHSTQDFKEAATYRFRGFGTLVKDREAGPVAVGDMWQTMQVDHPGLVASAESIEAGVALGRGGGGKAWPDLVMVKYFDAERDLQKYLAWNPAGRSGPLDNSNDKNAHVPGKLPSLCSTAKALRDKRRTGAIALSPGFKRYDWFLKRNPDALNIEAATTLELVEHATSKAVDAKYAIRELQDRMSAVDELWFGQRQVWLQRTSPVAPDATGFCLRNQNQEAGIMAVLLAWMVVRDGAYAVRVLGPHDIDRGPQPVPPKWWSGEAARRAASALVAWNLAQVDDRGNLSPTQMGTYWTAADLRLQGSEIFPDKSPERRNGGPVNIENYIGNVHGGNVMQGGHHNTQNIGSGPSDEDILHELKQYLEHIKAPIDDRLGVSALHSMAQSNGGSLPATEEAEEMKKHVWGKLTSTLPDIIGTALGTAAKGMLGV